MNNFVFSIQNKLLLTLNLIIMKKVNVFCTLICTIILSSIFTSCNRDDYHEFSHDPKIESWVQENKKEIINFDWEKVTTFSEKEQKAILRALSPKQRKALWQKKVNHILTLDLSKEEKRYIKWFAEIF